MARNLVLILGDQLSPELSSLAAGDQDHDVVMLAEVAEETDYVPHHKKKIAFLFSAMRHFAQELQEAGWRVSYTKLDAQANTGTLRSEVARAIKRVQPDRVVVTEPGEYRLRADMEGWSAALGLPVEILEDDRFICSHAAFQDWAAGRKQLRMENFYREIRRKTGLLMDGDKPVGEKWNFDAENRKPAGGGLAFPEPLRCEPDALTRDVLKLVEDQFADRFGDLEPFWFATTRDDAGRALDRFIDEALPSFGDYQDAMQTDERFLFHSVLSLYINAGLLDPLHVCEQVEAAYFDGHAPLNAVEGLIRQIIGWREYVRGIYWLRMPTYVDENFFGATRALPDFYWTAETDMACIRAAVTQTKEEAYAHHIQRLMVTGNFAMLAGVNPREVHEWYLAVYADAYEWVELPNTLGMSQFADGGLLGSKPYASSGAYINRMSNYCKSCAFDVKTKTGDGACPFNYLYWDFLARNEKKLRGNPRLGRPYSTWDRMDGEKQSAYRKSAKRFLSKL
ncbi:MAG: cryptochrome/photolyase family protein [Pseudomonadota bacterium]